MLPATAPEAFRYNTQKKKENIRRCTLYGVGVGGVRAIGKLTDRVSDVSDVSDVRGNNSTKKDDWAAAKTKILECREIQENGFSSFEQNCSTAFLGILEIRGLLAATLKLQFTPDELISLLDAFGCIEAIRKKGKEIRRVGVNKFVMCLKRLDASSREEQKSNCRKEQQIKISNCSDNDNSILPIEMENLIDNSSSRKSKNGTSMIESGLALDIDVGKNYKDLKTDQSEKNTEESGQFRISRDDSTEVTKSAGVAVGGHKKESQTLSSERKRMMHRHRPITPTAHTHSTAHSHMSTSPSRKITTKNQIKAGDKYILSSVEIPIPIPFTANASNPLDPAVRESATIRRKSESPETEESSTCCDLNFT